LASRRNQLILKSDSQIARIGISHRRKVPGSNMATLRPLPLVALASALLFSAISPAQHASPAARIVNPVDENQLVPLKGNVNPQANAKNDHGAVSDSLPMDGLTLVLSRAPERQAAFDAYVQSEYDPGSPNFHHWLTPAQIGQLYGPAQSDIAAISAWLTSKGFTVTDVALDGMTISFRGTAGQVTNAFHTEIHNLSVNGKAHIANMSDPQIPEALAPVVFGIKGLHNFLPHPLHRVGSKVQFSPGAHGWVRQQTSSGAGFTAGSLRKPAPAASAHSTSSPRPAFYIADYNEGVEEDVAPADFASIYNLPSGWPSTSSANGTGQIITVVGTSDIDTTDVTNFKTAFGLPAGAAPVIAHGPDGDPGNCGNNPTDDACTDGDLEENSLDVEWSGAVAPGAQIVLVTDAYNNQQTPTNDPIFDGAQWAINNALVSGSAVYGSRIVSVSYGLCELYSGTSSNVAYNNLWETAAGEGIAVFVATGDAGSPSCDDGGDADGNPYAAQYGLSVNGLASTPYNTAVGGTDFSWCNPTIIQSGSSAGMTQGCATTDATKYWNTSNSSTTQASAKGYVPETPWNDTCENPINAAFLESIATFVGAGTFSTPEESCNFVYEDALQLYFDDGDPMLATYLDTVGGSGGVSSCVLNDADTSSTPTCTSGATSTGSSFGSLTLVNNGWPAPSWQTGSGVTGTSGLTQRAIPDVSFFAGDGGLDSATLICVSNDGAGCTDISQTGIGSGGAEEVGGTSVATPEMAGVMALINQSAKGTQGLPNKQLYELASKQNSSSCSSEEATASGSCYFNDVDQGTNAMACVAVANTSEGGAIYAGDGEWEESEPYLGTISPNCSLINAADTVGTLSGASAAAGYDQASGLGSLNVANVVSAWVSDAGTHTATMTVITTPAASSGTITLASGDSLVIKVTVTGGDGNATGAIAVGGNGYNNSGTLDSSGAATITIPPGSLAPGTDTLTVTYGGDATYESTSQTFTVNAAAAVATVTVSAPDGGNVANSVPVSVGVTGPGATTPTGTVTLTGGSYSSPAVTLSTSGTASFTIPAGDLPVGTDKITANYSGDSNYTSATGTISITMVSTAPLTPKIVATATPTSIDTSQTLTLNVTLSGPGALPTGSVTLTSTNAATGSTLASGITAQLTGGVAAITVPANNLNAGSDTLSVAYSGDSVYAMGTGTVSVTVTQSTYSLTAATASPASVSPGATATSAITGAASTTGYVGVVTVNSCTLTTSPSTAVNFPTCTAAGTITYTGGSTDTPSGTATATVTTYANQSAMIDTHRSKALYGAGGTVLAFLIFLGIPARRKSWRALLGAIALLAGLGTLSACGGGGISQNQSTATSPGNYTFTVTGTGNDSANTQESATFTLTVN
jgi:trimeric autotransporter adhesin